MPSPLLTVVKVDPRSMSEAVIFALGITPPEGSVTLPVMAAATCWLQPRDDAKVRTVTILTNREIKPRGCLDCIDLPPDRVCSLRVKRFQLTASHGLPQ